MTDRRKESGTWLERERNEIGTWLERGFRAKRPHGAPPARNHRVAREGGDQPFHRDASPGRVQRTDIPCGFAAMSPRGTRWRRWRQRWSDALGLGVRTAPKLTCSTSQAPAAPLRGAKPLLSSNFPELAPGAHNAQCAPGASSGKLLFLGTFGPRGASARFGASRGLRALLPCTLGASSGQWGPARASSSVDHPRKNKRENRPAQTGGKWRTAV